jgi:hypothetical protein
MSVKGWILTAAAMVMMIAAASPANAHHSITATYLQDQTVTIEGDLVQFLFRNPHSFVHVVVKEPDGRSVRYGVEWYGAGELGERGVTRETLKPGDHVIISGNPGRNPQDHRIRLESLRRPRDGFVWRP